MKKTINTILIFMLTLLAFTSCDNSHIFNEISQKAPSDNRNLEIIGQKDNLIYFKSKNGIESYDHATKSYTTLTSSMDAASSAVFFFDTTGNNIIIYNDARGTSNTKKFFVLELTNNNKFNDEVNYEGLTSSMNIVAAGNSFVVIENTESSTKKLQVATATYSESESKITINTPQNVPVKNNTDEFISLINNAIIVGNEDDLHSDIFLVSSDGVLNENSIKFQENGTPVSLKELEKDVSIVTPDNKFIGLSNGKIYYNSNENSTSGEVVYEFKVNAGRSVGGPAFSGKIKTQSGSESVVVEDTFDTLVFTSGGIYAYECKEPETGTENKVKQISSDGIIGEICGYFQVDSFSNGVLVATKNNGFYERNLKN